MGDERGAAAPPVRFTRVQAQKAWRRWGSWAFLCDVITVGSLINGEWTTLPVFLPLSIVLTVRALRILSGKAAPLSTLFRKSADPPTT
jgi:hypothetical protein